MLKFLLWELIYISWSLLGKFILKLDPAQTENLPNLNHFALMVFGFLYFFIDYK